MSNPQDVIPPNAVADLTEDPEERLRSVHERLKEMTAFWTPKHQVWRQDDAFIAGEQWPSEIRQRREREGRPCMVYNLLPAFVRQITNRARQDMPQLRVKPVDSDRNQTPDMENVQGTKRYSLSDVYNGIIRHIEHVSRAEQAYLTALEHAVRHGFGVFKLNTRECPTDPFVQDLVIERVRDPYAVYMDPGASRSDWSDAQDAFQVEHFSHDAFQARFPKARAAQMRSSTAGFASTLGLTRQHSRPGVIVVTYFWVEHVNDEVVKMTDGRIHFMSDIEDVLDDMKASGLYVQRDEEDAEMRKKVRRPVCKWQRFQEQEALTDPTATPFSAIPFFPVTGDEYLLSDGTVSYGSAVRDALDAQRSYNYWRSAATEVIALAPKAPFAVTASQIAGHEGQWEKANSSAMPFLVYNHVEGVPPPARMSPPNPAAAELSQAAQDANDMQSIIGLHEADLGERSNERSGRAIQARQRQGAIGTFTYPANLGRAIEAMGRLMVEAIPSLYDTDRVMRVRLPDDTEDFVRINEAVMDQDSGQIRIVHDIAYGKYDVVIDTGPSYQTMREEGVDAMLETLQILPPEAQTAVVHLMVREMGFPGAPKVAAILRKLIPDQLKSEDDRAADLPQGVGFNDQGQPVWEEGANAGQPYQPPMSPEMKAQLEIAQVERAKAEADMAKAQGDQAMAQAKQAEAQADQAMAEAKRVEAQARLAEAGRPPATPAPAGPTPQDLRGMMAELMEAHRNDPNAHDEVVEEAIAEAVSDLVPRIRGLVERTAGAAQAPQPLPPLAPPATTGGT